MVVAPLLSALLIVAGFFLDPAIGDSGRELAREYAEHPGREQVSALALHFAFALLAIPAVALIVSTRDRGAWLGNVAAIFGVLGLTTLPGFLLTTSTTSRSTASSAATRSSRRLNLLLVRQRAG